MGFNILFPILVGTSISIVLASQIGPKVVETIKVNKIESKVIDTQDAIFESTKRYITMMQKTPLNINELIDSGFLSGKYNDNGFGGNFEISIDEIKGILNVYTSIEDERAQAIFLNSMKNKFIPKKDGLKNFITSFVIPMDVLHGNGLFMAGVPTQKLAPDSTKHRYWYDTSSGEAILKMFDGENWVLVKGTGGGGGSSLPNYTDVSGEIFKTGQQGDIKYVYDSTNKVVLEYIHHNGSWTLLYNGNNPAYEAKPIDYSVLNGHKYKKDKDDNLVLATVNCLGIPAGQTVKVEGVDYLVVIDGTGTYGIKNATNKARASTLCTSNVTNMSSMSFGASFNQDISKWDTKRVTNMYRMFQSATSFNQYINDWDVGSVTNMSEMFNVAISFNQPLYNWNTSNVDTMSSMFAVANSFNQYLSTWNTSKVIYINTMFYEANSFNNGDNIGQSERPLTWNTSKVNVMYSMFQGATSFNQQLPFDTSKVYSMYGMFYNAVLFNQNIDSWNVSKVNHFGNMGDGMFKGATSFNNGCAAGVANCPMNWTINTTSNIYMNSMFHNASSFNQNLSGWNISKVSNKNDYDTGAGLWEAKHKPLFP